MPYDLPGPKTTSLFNRGLPLFRNGASYSERAARATAKGYQPPAQIMLDRASGDFIWDLDGNRYIDFQNGWATNPLGNCHPEVLEAVQAAQQRYGFHWEHPLRFELAERLAEIMPGKALPRFSFEVSGTEAVESAVHLALCHKQRRHIISFTSSFHGEGLGTKLISGYSGEANLYMEGWNGGVIKAPYPYSENIPAGMTEAQYVEYCLWYLESHIPTYLAPAENIAAILVEPGLAEGGNWIPSVDFLQGIRRICNEQDWLMIADEVLTGLGRTGRMWGVEHYDVLPDILVVGKNLSGGVEPCAGVATTDLILGDNPRATAGSTFAGTPAGCAAGLKTLDIFERDGVVEQAAELGSIAQKRMADWQERYEIVSQVRTLGLLMGVSFKNPNSSEEDYFIARSVRDQMLRLGIWALCDSEPTVRMYPALNMDKKVLLQGLDLMEEAINQVNLTGNTVGDYPALPSGNVGF